jgi:2,3-bisphosphoglycerate-dependent phosphoglycerate mutase
MKIYILRHEDRTQDATMFSPLTENGLENSIKMIEELEDIDFDIIYSSPYIRTLQTIYPYSKKHNKKINLEYSLCEFQSSYLVPENSYQVRLPEYLAKSFNYNPNYKSIFQPENINYPENEHEVNKRVKMFLTKLMNDNLESRKRILLVTHQAICNSILKIATKDLDYQHAFTDSYPKGGITKVWDVDEWIYKPINYN